MKVLETAIRSLLLVQDTPRQVAFAFAVGVFFGFSPFLGLHTVLGIVFAFLLRLNKTAVLIGVFLNNPWMLAPYYTFATWLGVRLMGLPEAISVAHLGFTDLWTAELWYWLAAQWRLVIPAFVGSFLLSLILAVAAYPSALLLLRRYPSSD